MFRSIGSKDGQINVTILVFIGLASAEQQCWGKAAAFQQEGLGVGKSVNCLLAYLSLC